MKLPYRTTPSPLRRATGFVLVLLLVAGLSGSAFVGLIFDIRGRDALLNQAEAIAEALPLDDVKAIQGNAHDLNSPVYSRLKQKVTQIRLHNSDLRFVYLMGSKDSDVFYYVDSEPADSRASSSPGLQYDEASPRLTQVFTSKQAAVEGPKRNDFGVWMSGFAPVVDRSTGQVVAVVGVYMSAYNFYLQTLLVALVPLLMLSIPFVHVLRERKIIAKEDEIVQLKTQFVSIASHELRSPLTGMLWAIQSMLKSDKLKPTQDHMLRNMYQSVQSSIATVNEILDASIFERSKQIGLRRDLVELTSVMKTVETTLNLAAQEHGIKIAYDDTWPKQAYCYGDVAALKRAFMNIVSNAIKYSRPNSTVKFQYNRQGGQHIFSVSDQGIGIPTADLPKILKGYYRSENATKVSAHGTGIGMYVTRSIIEEQGGQMNLESQEAKGTTVHVQLPAVEPKV